MLFFPYAKGAHAFGCISCDLFMVQFEVIV